jgi:hypothetical protein
MARTIWPTQYYGMSRPVPFWYIDATLRIGDFDNGGSVALDPENSASRPVLIDQDEFLSPDFRRGRRLILHIAWGLGMRLSLRVRPLGREVVRGETASEPREECQYNRVSGFHGARIAMALDHGQAF